MLQHFVFKDNRYLSGTIVKIYDSQRHNFKYNRYLKFVGFNENKYCKFCSLYDCWENFSISKKELEKYIESITKPVVFENIEIKSGVDPKDIDGIIPAWTWYVLALIASLLVVGLFNKILIPVVTFCIFTFWRSRKMKGE